jgi:hypothetical protein
MQLILHSSAQETESGDGPNLVEPGFRARALIVNVTQISTNLLGNVVVKVQHSVDGSTWIDIPNLATAGISATGAVTVAISPDFACMDHIQLVWTFINTNSITFSALVTGDK